MIRPKPARWFEILAARDDATVALEALAATGAVELEARPSAVLPAALADLRSQLSEFAELSQRYHAYWPRANVQASAFPEPPAATLARSLTHLRAWAEDAEPVISQLQRGDAERTELLLWRRVLGDDRRVRDRLRAARRRGPGAARPAVRVPAGQRARASRRERSCAPSTSIDTMVCALCALTVGAAEDVEQLAQQAALLKGRVYDAPSWLRADADETERYIAPRLEALEREEARLRAELDGAARQARPVHRTRRRQPAAVGDPERARARVGRSVLLDHRLDQRFRRPPARRSARALRRPRAAALSAAGAEGEGAAAAREPDVGEAVRDLQPRAGNARRATRPTRRCCSRSPCR